VAYTKVSDIKFGDINSSYLEAAVDQAQAVGATDPRRSNPLLLTGRAISEVISPDISKGTVSPRPQLCMILSSQANKNPSRCDDAEAVRAAYSQDASDGDQKYYTYKVFIDIYHGAMEPPESVSKRKGKHHGRTGLMKEGIPLPGSFLEAVAPPNGQIVRFEGDPSKSGCVVLAEVTNKQILLPGGKIDRSFRDAMAPRFGMGIQPKPQKARPGDVTFFTKLQDSPHFSGFSEEFLAGLAANAKKESGYDVSAAGDTRKAPDPKNHAMLVGGEWTCSFGYWQLNVCSETGGGGSFAKAFNLYGTDQKEELYEAITDENKQFAWIAGEMKRLFGSGVSSGGTAKNWGEQIAIKFERCKHCGAGDSSTIERGDLAEKIHDLVTSWNPDEDASVAETTSAEDSPYG